MNDPNFSLPPVRFLRTEQEYNWLTQFLISGPPSRIAIARDNLSATIPIVAIANQDQILAFSLENPKLHRAFADFLAGNNSVKLFWQENSNYPQKIELITLIKYYEQPFNNLPDLWSQLFPDAPSYLKLYADHTILQDYILSAVREVLVVFKCFERILNGGKVFRNVIQPSFYSNISQIRYMPGGEGTLPVSASFPPRLPRTSFVEFSQIEPPTPLSSPHETQSPGRSERENLDLSERDQIAYWKWVRDQLPEKETRKFTSLVNFTASSYGPWNTKYKTEQKKIMARHYIPLGSIQGYYYYDEEKGLLSLAEKKSPIITTISDTDLEKIHGLSIQSAVHVLINSSAHFAQFPLSERQTVVTQKLNEAIQRGKIRKNSGKIYLSHP